MATPSVEQAGQYQAIGPGLSLFKKVVTYGGVAATLALILFIGWYQKMPWGVSTIGALVFLAGFIYYLRIMAPVPFTITIGQEEIVRRSQKGEVVAVRYDQLKRIKEEFFPNKQRISLTLYRHVTETGQKSKVWTVYRDDITDLDGLADALEQAPVPSSVQWDRETVHE